MVKIWPSECNVDCHGLARFGLSYTRRHGGSSLQWIRHRRRQPACGEWCGNSDL
jgi:hypothetical protein